MSSIFLVFDFVHLVSILNEYIKVKKWQTSLTQLPYCNLSIYSNLIMNPHKARSESLHIEGVRVLGIKVFATSKPLVCTLAPNIIGPHYGTYFMACIWHLGF